MRKFILIISKNIEENAYKCMNRLYGFYDAICGKIIDRNGKKKTSTCAVSYGTGAYSFAKKELRKLLWLRYA